MTLIDTIRTELTCNNAVLAAVHAALIAAGARPSSKYQDEWDNVPPEFNSAPLIQSVCDSFGVAPMSIGFYVVDGRSTDGMEA
jgi:hypothetical protein